MNGSVKRRIIQNFSECLALAALRIACPQLALVSSRDQLEALLILPVVSANPLALARSQGQSLIQIQSTDRPRLLVQIGMEPPQKAIVFEAS